MGEGLPVVVKSLSHVSLWHHGWQHARLPGPSPSPGVCSNPCWLSWWCHPTISSSVIYFSSCLQSFPSSRSFPMSRLFTSGGQSSAGTRALFSSVQFSCSVGSDSLRPHGLQHARLPCPSPASRACSNSCPSSQWCHPTISSSVTPFSSYPQSFPASGSVPVSCSSHQVVRVLEFQHLSFQWLFRLDLL